jgi:hypothetical protein
LPPQRREGGIGTSAVHDHDHPSLAGDVHRVGAQQLARPGDVGPNRHPRLVDHDGNLGLPGHFVEDRGHTAAGRVAQAAHPFGHGVEQRRDQPVQRRGVGDDVGLDAHLTPGEHDGHAVLADRPGHDHRVTRSRRRGARSPGRD